MLILAFGWFGIHTPVHPRALPGKTGTLRIGSVAGNKMLAGMAAALALCLYMWLRTARGRVNVGQGLLAGLVEITRAPADS